MKAGGNVSLPEEQSRPKAAPRSVRFADQDEEARGPGGGQEGEPASEPRSSVLPGASRSGREDSGEDLNDTLEQDGVEFTGYNEPEPTEGRGPVDNEQM